MTNSLRPIAERIARRVLAKELADLRTANDWLRKHADRLEIAVAEANEVITILGKRPNRAELTPTESALLDIVNKHPGYLGVQVCDVHMRNEYPDEPAWKFEHWDMRGMKASLESLFFKGYVRRVNCGNGSFRYYPVGGGVE
jgi:hypothetical protein